MCRHLERKKSRVKSKTTNGLYYEGFGLSNYRVQREVYRCVQCGEYSTEFNIEHSDIQDPRHIFPDQKETKMKKSRG